MQEVEERLSFYSEMIDDRIDEGLSEADAVADVGTVSGIAEQIICDIPLTSIAKERIMPKRRMKTWEKVLLALGSPIWFSLSIAAFAVSVSLYAVLWSVIVSVWAVFVSFVGGAALGAGTCAVNLFTSHIPTALVMLSGGSVCAGLAILTFIGSKALTKGIVFLTVKIPLAIKKCIVKKEAA
jgi:uncharacterized membrane protein